MKILLDENVPSPLASALTTLLRRDHEVVHVIQIEGWSGTKDQTLYDLATKAGFQLVLTNDIRQMQRSHEVEAIARSGLHRVQYRQRHNGLVGVGLAMAALCGSMPILLGELEAVDGQRLVELKSLDPGPRQRFSLRDPVTDPPKHWPHS